MKLDLDKSDEQSNLGKWRFQAQLLTGDISFSKEALVFLTLDGLVPIALEGSADDVMEEIIPEKKCVTGLKGDGTEGKRNQSSNILFSNSCTETLSLSVPSIVCLLTPLYPDVLNSYVLCCRIRNLLLVCSIR